MGTISRIKGFILLASTVLLAAAAGCGEAPAPGEEGDTAAQTAPAAQKTQTGETTQAVATDVKAVSSAITVYLGPVVTVTIHTGADDLRGGSNPSVAYISVLRADGRWSSERAFSKDDGHRVDLDLLSLSAGANDLYANSNKQYTISDQAAGWDGFDPCATRVKVRMAQGSCFACTEDYWSMRGLAVDYQDSASSASWRMATFGSYKLGGSTPSVTVNATQTPAGEVCANGTVADCNGLTNLPVSTSQSWDTDGYCDNGQFGAFLVCSAFKFDSGLCGGLPPTWTCPTAYYNMKDGCDCNCGAWDPDCNVAGQTLFGCGTGSNITCQNVKQSPGVFAPQCVAGSVVR